MKPPIQYALAFLTFGCIAFALAPTLFAVSSALSLRQIATPAQSLVGHLAQLGSTFILITLPVVLALRPEKAWLCPWAVLAAATLWVALYCLVYSPRLSLHEMLGSSTFLVFFSLPLGLMCVAAVLARPVRTAISDKRGVAMVLGIFGYACLALIAFMFVSVPLYAE